MGALAQQYVGKGLSTLIDLVVLLDSLSVAVAFVVAGSRVFFALGRDGLLPPVIARTSKRETPLGGNLIILAAGIVALVYGGLTKYGDAVKLPNNIEAFSISAAAGSFLIEAVYGMLAIAGVVIIWRSCTGAGRLWRVVVAVLGFATPVLAYYGSLHPFPTYPTDRGLIFAGIAALIVVVWFGYLSFAHPERIRRRRATPTSTSGCRRWTRGWGPLRSRRSPPVCSRAWRKSEHQPPDHACCSDQCQVLAPIGTAGRGGQVVF